MAGICKVLVVDDEIDVCETMTDVLEYYFEDKVEVTSAHNYFEALETIRHGKVFDIIISDIMMPGMKGTDLVSQLHRYFPSAEILIVTGALESIDQYDQKLIDKIPNEKYGFLEKPISNETLHRSIRRAMKSLELENSNEALIGELTKSSDLGNAMLAHGHDLKNIINSSTMDIDSFIMPTLQEALPENDQKHEILGSLSDMYTSLGQAENLIKSLLAANREDNEVRNLSAFDLVDQALTIAAPYAKRANVDWRMEPNYFGSIKGSNTLINVFVNFIKNAVEAFKNYSPTDKKEIVIKIAEVESNQVSITIADNGSGIPENILKELNKGVKISTKGQEGNGYGVSGSKRVIEGFGGSLLIKSVVNVGTEFIVTLQK